VPGAPVDTLVPPGIEKRLVERVPAGLLADERDLPVVGGEIRFLIGRLDLELGAEVVVGA
jgi:hypothetical protein